ncbi:metallophosphoesterase domain-containing protein 1 [Suillus fuscotomentosus]|uniref:Metallophosphoesterase domain-containing protein 1 n=1 Tax=Suillus fuscotomentosus TaxID=1912939 RepID=A0AAD4EHJ9_9AGAM|nr:metallophosphoesterase domain-containing protein 1 [Suillus fuscotomentosus]KAG1906354.1 metallophosphoesterase domain-containing protein 1 [Suillus fuscotomentosus]
MSGFDAIINRKAPSPWELFKTNPSLYIASKLYNSLSQRMLRPLSTPIRTICISDTHNTDISALIPPGDILIHAGDLTHSGTPRELQVTFDWLVSLPHEHKIVIARNHDTYLQTAEDCGIIYLEDEAHTIQVRGRTFKIFGSPFTPQHGNGAFQYPRMGVTGTPSHWSVIPNDTDILITHGPPHGHLDLAGLGCRALLARIWELGRTHQPVLHVFGHIHGGRGIENMPWDSAQSIWEDIVLKKGGWFHTMHLLWAMLWGGQDNGIRTIAVNASVVGGPRDRDIQPPVVIDI